MNPRHLLHKLTAPKDVTDLCDVIALYDVGYGEGPEVGGVDGQEAVDRDVVAVQQVVVENVGSGVRVVALKKK